MSRRPRWVLAIVLLLWGTLYARAVGYDFVWDDVEAVRDNPLLEAPVAEGIWATQHDHLDPSLRRLRGSQPVHDSYRPGLFLSWRLDEWWFDRDPWAMHAHNLLLGAINILLAYQLARQWLKSRWPALVVAAIFALHPLQVEPCVYVSGRGSLLSGMFSLLAAVAVLHAIGAAATSRRRQWGFGALGVLAYLASLLCKESTLGLPFAIVAVAWAVCDNRRRVLAHGAALCAAAVVYLVVRSWVTATATTTAGVSALLALPGIVLRYVAIFLVPSDLSTERLYTDNLLIAGWLALAVATVTAAVLLRRRPERVRQRARAIPSGLVWAVMLTGPSAVVVLVMGIVADRYAYLPVLGLAVALVQLGRWAHTQSRIGRVVVPVGGVIWGGLLVTITALQVPVWQSNFTLYSHAVAMEPRSSMAHFRLGYVYSSTHNFEAALPLLERAVALDAGNVRALNNLGVTYLNLRRLPEARTTLRQAIEASGGVHYRAWYNLGLVELGLGHGEAACQAFARAFAIHPTYDKAQARFQRHCAGGPTPTQHSGAP